MSLPTVARRPSDTCRLPAPVVEQLPATGVRQPDGARTGLACLVGQLAHRAPADELLEHGCRAAAEPEPHRAVVPAGGLGQAPPPPPPPSPAHQPPRGRPRPRAPPPPAPPPRPPPGRAPRRPANHP